MSARELLARAQAWLDQDPDPQTAAELRDLIAATRAGDADASADLAARFDGRLAFGTAGLRGRLGAGPRRMNRVLVTQAAAGLGAYLLARADGTTPSVVIGYDGRRNSRVFAVDSAEILQGAGVRAILLPRLLPTPVLAFAVRHLDASAGVMVTASHNPPDDNGYKVYLGGADAGSQIVPPADAQIAAAIAQAAAAPIGVLPRSQDYEIASEEVLDAYVRATVATAPAPDGASGLRWVYTAMHGVGWETASRVVAEAGYPQPTTVTAQIEPDGAFPTVAFPNPEEPGAMDLAFETARAVDAELVIANDPDADRLAVGVPDPQAPGGWRRLGGNETGLLLGWRAARRWAQDREHGEAPEAASLACSLVSSPALEAVARRYGLDFTSTLTGFKWISRADHLVYGFEEALGYLVDPDVVRDKDGISAALAVLQMAAEAKAQGRTVANLLDEFATTFGAYASTQVALRVEDLGVITGIMASLRREPPTRLGDVAVTRVDDYLTPDGDRPTGDIIGLVLGDDARVLVRPSGTEPKLKAYLDVRGTDSPDAAARLDALRQAVSTLLDTLA